MPYDIEKIKKEININNELLNMYYGGSSRSRGHQSKAEKFIKKNKKHFIRIMIISLALFFVYLIFYLITLPPNYTIEETLRNGQRFEELIKKTGSHYDLFQGATKLLKKHPNFYKKVVNNIEDIKFQSGICPYMCIMSYIQFSSFAEMVTAEKQLMDASLIVNPKGITSAQTELDLASALVHEADHIEYLKSSRLRKYALMVKCNPITNAHISVNSMLPSIAHRIKPLEICAEKEQILFHRETNTESGYELRSGFFLNFFYFLIGSFQAFFSFLGSIFKNK